MRVDSPGRQRMDRRLAAILAGDVVGYSRLMQANEADTLKALKEHRKQLIDPAIASHHGRIVKTTGDGMLVEFASVVDAVTCAVAIQRGMIARNASVPDDRRIVFRIGINVGDIIVDGDDIFGDGVNVAARLEGLCEPGGICISRAANDQIIDKLALSFTDLGEQVVKNITRSIGVFGLTTSDIASLPADAKLHDLDEPGADHAGFGRLRRARLIKPLMLGFAVLGAVALGWFAFQSRLFVEGHSDARQPARPVSVTVPPRLSVVVLPFANLNNDPEQEYFADGLTEDVTTDLSRITGSFVIAANTAFTLKGKPIDVKQVGRDLGVRYVLEGSVQRSDQQVRLNVRLVDSETGNPIWADRFDGDRQNLLAMQNEVTARLAHALSLELVQADAKRVERQKTTSVSVLDHLSLGWGLARRATNNEVLQEGRRQFELALAQDPNSVDAMNGVAFVLVTSVAQGWPGEDRAKRVRDADDLLARARAIDPANGDTAAAMSVLRRLQGRLDEAIVEGERALAMNPNDAYALRQTAAALLKSGRLDLAVYRAKQLVRVSPRDPYITATYWVLGESELLLGHADQAVDALQKARQINPQLFYVHLDLASALALQGHTDDARAELAEAIRLGPYKKLSDYTSQAQNSQPAFRDRAEKTLYAGLKLAGMPDE